MYKSLLISTFVFCYSVAFADQAQVVSIYKEYDKQQKQFFASDISRLTIAKQLTPLVDQWNSEFEKMAVLEVNEKLEISPERVQMAIDLEIIQYLANFAKSTMSKDDCDEAKSAVAQELGDKSDPEPLAISVAKVLQKLCK